MTILAVETATLVCGAAVLADGRIVAEDWAEERNLHAERILACVDRVLRKSGVAPARLDAVAVSNGPGSFTGLRIGVSVAKGIAAAAGKPIVAVPTLTALAHRAAREGGAATPPFLLAALDARRDEVYCQLFARKENGVAEIDAPRDLTAAAAASLCDGMEVWVAGDGARKVCAAAPVLRTAPEPFLRCSAAGCAFLAEELFRAGKSSDPGSVEPMYIKDFFVRHRPPS